MVNRRELLRGIGAAGVVTSTIPLASKSASASSSTTYLQQGETYTTDNGAEVTVNNTKVRKSVTFGIDTQSIMAPANSQFVFSNVDTTPSNDGDAPTYEDFVAVAGERQFPTMKKLSGIAFGRFTLSSDLELPYVHDSSNGEPNQSGSIYCGIPRNVPQDLSIGLSNSSGDIVAVWEAPQSEKRRAGGRRAIGLSDFKIIEDGVHRGGQITLTGTVENKANREQVLNLLFGPTGRKTNSPVNIALAPEESKTIEKAMSIPGYISIPEEAVEKSNGSRSTMINYQMSVDNGKMLTDKVVVEGY